MKVPIICAFAFSYPEEWEYIFSNNPRDTFVKLMLFLNGNGLSLEVDLPLSFSLTVVSPLCHCWCNGLAGLLFLLPSGTCIYLRLPLNRKNDLSENLPDPNMVSIVYSLARTIDQVFLIPYFLMWVKPLISIFLGDPYASILPFLEGFRAYSVVY